MTRNWVVVASAEHVARGRKGGFMQACHGRLAPLRRVEPGDRVVCYSPTHQFRGTEKLQAFTALGIARRCEPYPVDMGNGFRPFRRDVDWLVAEAAPIRPLLDRLEIAAGKRNWGFRLRFGFFEIGDGDMRVIAEAMRAAMFSGATTPQSGVASAGPGDITPSLVLAR